MRRLINWHLISINGRPYKIEDFKELSDDVNIEDQSLFLRHVNTRRPCVLERILARWDDAKRYFLEFVPKQKEYKVWLHQMQDIKQSKYV